MALFFDHAMELYNKSMEYRDRRLDGRYLMDSPFPTLSILGFYLFFATTLGPRMMKNRKPLELRGVLVVYNVAMFYLSYRLLKEFLLGGWWGEYSLRCQPVDTSNNPTANRMVDAAHLSLFVKLIELLDTVFFVLRKKYNQVSFLHLFHHSMMPVHCWIGTRFVPGGHGGFFLVINSFVHLFMYAYYGLAALGPKYQKYLWWKRYLTLFQIVQFVMVFVHALQLFFIDCNYPIALGYWILINTVAILLLFCNFYVKEYIAKKNKSC